MGREPCGCRLTPWWRSIRANTVFAVVLTAAGQWIGEVQGADEPAPPARIHLQDKHQKIIDQALDWLAKHQLDDGRWSFDLRKCECDCGKSDRPISVEDVADEDGGAQPGRLKEDDGDYRATALALLAFLGDGHTHNNRGKHAKTVERGIACLTKRALHKGPHKKVGQLWSDGNQEIIQDHAMFAQGYATQALVECYWLSGDADVRDAAQAAVDYVCSAQDALGGWHQGKPRTLDGNLYAAECQIMALMMADKAGLMMPGELPLMRDPIVFERTWWWLKDGLQSRNKPVGYRVAAREGEEQGFDTLPVGLVVRLCTDWKYKGKPDRDWLLDGADQLVKQDPKSEDPYHMLATAMVLRHVQEKCAPTPDLAKAIETWRRNLHEMMEKGKRKDGHFSGSHWAKTISEQDGVKAGTRLYRTVMAALIMEADRRHAWLFGP